MATPDTTVHREPSVRSFADWTPGLRRSALALADGGTLRLAADLCEALRADDRVQGDLGKRVRGLLGLPLTFQVDRRGDGRRKTTVTKAIDDDWWSAFKEETLADLADWGVLLGVGLGELVWLGPGEALPEHGFYNNTSNRVIGFLKVWHPRWLRWDWERREWRLTVDGSSEIAITPGDGKWVLFTPYGSHRPWAQGIWRATSLGWLVKNFAIHDRERHGEVYGTPIRVGVTPEGADAKVRKEVAADIADLGRDTTIGLPAGFDMKLIEALGKGETFENRIKWADEAITISILGQLLTTKVEGGSRAAAEVHDGVRHDLRQTDAESVSTTTHNQALTWWAEYNFGNRNLAPWPRWATTPPEDKKANAETQKIFAESLGPLAAAGVDTRKLCEERGLPMRPEEPEPEPVEEPEPGAEPEPAEESETEPEPGAEPAASPKRAATTPLAGPARRPDPMVRGQVHADAVADGGRQAGARAFAPDLAAVLSAVDEATGYEDLRARLLKVYEGMDAERFAGIVERALILAELGGRHAVLEGL